MTSAIISPHWGKATFQNRIGTELPCELLRRSAKLDHREGSDTYHAEIFRTGRYRVILCMGALQWIIQRRDRLAGTRWHESAARNVGAARKSEAA